MAGPSLPIVANSNGTWGGLLNTWLSNDHNPDGTHHIGVSVMGFGAKGDGVTDDTAAIQAAISAAQAMRISNPPPLGGAVPVYFPPGYNYLIGSGPLLISNPVRLTGGGSGSRIFSNNGPLIDFQNTFLIHVEIDHLTFDATGGHIFTNPNIRRSSFHHLLLIQRSGNYSIFALGPSGTALATTDFSNILQYAYPDPVSGVRTAPWWNLYFPGGKNMDVLKFHKVESLAQSNANGAFDNSQYVFDFACTALTSGGILDRLHFSQCDFQNTLGGAIRLLSAQGVLLDQCSTGNIYNQGTPTVSVGNSMIYIGNYPGSPASAAPRGTTIIGYTHESSSTITWGGKSNIELDSSASCSTIMNPIHTDTGANGNVLRINLNGSASAQIIAPVAGYTLLNRAADTIEIGNGAISLGGTAYTNP